MISLEEFEEKLKITTKFIAERIERSNTTKELDSINTYSDFNSFRQVLRTVNFDKSFEKTLSKYESESDKLIRDKFQTLTLEKLSKIDSVKVNTDVNTRLDEIIVQVHALTDEYNKVAKEIAHPIRLGVISSEYNGIRHYVTLDKKTNLYDVGTEAEDVLIGIKTKDEADELAAKLQLLAAQECQINDYDNRPYASIYSSDYGWFPSGLNC